MNVHGCCETTIIPAASKRAIDAGPSDGKFGCDVSHSLTLLEWTDCVIGLGARCWLPVLVLALRLGFGNAFALPLQKSFLARTAPWLGTC